MINLLRIRDIAKEKNVTIAELAGHLGVTPQGLQKMIRENRMEVSLLMKVIDKLEVPLETFVSMYREGREARVGSDIVTSSELHLKEYTGHIEVKLVTTKARAGYAGAYYSDEYLKDMPSVLIEADKDYHGKYLAFEVDGDSMEPTYNKGDIVICREVKRDLWQYKLHYSEWDFIIAHGTKGIMLKEIVDHNTETGEIVCHSINQESGRNKDFTLNLREVAFLYNVVEHRISGKNRRRNR